MSKAILIVEDNLKLANYLKQRLVEQDYDVSTESRGDKAVFRIVNGQPDLVILDIMLPGMNGREVCQTVRSDYRGKLLMLTALNDTENEVSCLNYGADDYVTKPVASEVLIARVAALLRRPSTIKPPTKIKLGLLEMDLVGKTLTLARKEIELKPNEFELLALLAKNPDHIFNRNSIMQALRGIDYDGLDRGIDSRISQLRKKLLDNLQKPYRIKTIHGRGYVLISDAWNKA